MGNHRTKGTLGTQVPTAIGERGAVTGIWYYLFLQPDWKLETFRTDDYGEGVDHFNVWGTHLVRILKQHYKLDVRTAARSKGLAYGMPRGRVDRLASDDWVFFHGKDFPRGLTLESEKRKLISAFGLSRVAAANPDKIRFELAKHEKMVPEEQKQLQDLLKIRIPY